MKKIIAVFAGVLIAVAASAKTWENFVNVGVRFPCNPLNLETENGEGKVKISPIAGLDLGYTGVHENGFSVRAILDYGYAGSDIKFGSDYFDGMNLEFLAGCGYAPIHDKNMFLGVYGIFGINYSMFEGSTEILIGNRTKNEYKYTFLLPVMGVNGTFIYTFSKSFSVYGTMTAEIVLPGKTERKVNSSSTKADTKTSFLVVPAIGVSWKF